MSLQTISKKRVLLSAGSDDQSEEEKMNTPDAKPAGQMHINKINRVAYQPSRASYHTMTGRLKRLFL